MPAKEEHKDKKALKLIKSDPHFTENQKRILKIIFFFIFSFFFFYLIYLYLYNFHYDSTSTYYRVYSRRYPFLLKTVPAFYWRNKYTITTAFGYLIYYVWKFAYPPDLPKSDNKKVNKSNKQKSDNKNNSKKKK
eukprot:TRINITY_DN15789_c0_g1_i1.p1 TRINITY_DN15789_c0_g1~~TRINITY_DN15789_c0_g1_i1.p1  ORF type:complete len:134 (-),score=13.66 TRINITY_DN15789_c0_g1_i1:243-644(-)